MIKEYYEAAKAELKSGEVSGTKVRQLLSSLRQEIKTEAGLEELFLLVEDDLEIMKQFLHHQDAKTRKNAALLMGDLEIDEYAQLLYEAYCEEEQMFVKASYLTALKAYDITPFLARLKQRVKELSALTRTEENRKHIEEELRALTDLLIQKEGIARHEFTGFPKAVECVLLTNKLYANDVATQVQELFKGMDESMIQPFSSGVRVTTRHVEELFELRTFQEMCFALPKCRMTAMDPVRAADEIAAAGIVSFLQKSHNGAGSFYYRIALKSKMDLSQVSQFTRRFAAELEQKTGGQLVNSPSDYEISIRLTENKKGGLNVLLQDHTITDARFAYRKEYMPTSIRPVQAALLVELAKEYMVPDAQVLDPFAGVATMLIERQMVVKANTSYAIDIQPEAIEKAKKNTKEAGQIIHFVNKDCLQFTHEYLFNEIFTNLPFAIGRTSEEDIAELYEAFFKTVHRWLAPQGTMILYTRDRGKLLRCAEKNGYRLLAEFKISDREQTYLEVLQ